ncbi:hypothetical protein A2738_01090 [Candidatus Nomurabacteria bacterium RIFCSPHIGHO2_01_FULL_42_15]|uniref:Uncharacterized protein n=1 Tax=Candidatus Nomurabacteria bacterium RIFCSPHIGHO2_01_FULL_42_15 TaxID=1801742 RepID=A0A1F6VFS7_9BACT|nr:MAG: hypothetical protein A2738_01090 [Candidatus Nomurabacteria bacterium RIFCSPHIGHO2_01_FULL_42_15]OGI93113.1 MAG: hypothetical protein A3A99_01080 [Candidatus Nomurabacteria bacterium RIFCSPLOWO2_01_FULL_41_18]
MTIFSKLNKKYLYYAIGAFLFVIVVIFFLTRREISGETIMVKRSLFVNQVSVSGKVETSSRAELGFADSGRIGRIFVKENQNVKAGQILAQLEITDLLADLKIKEINSRTSNVDLEDAKEVLEKVRNQEDTKVDNTYQALLTEDLELIPEVNDYGVDPPTLGGIYKGAEGRYKIYIDKENVTLPNYVLFTFNLENTKRVINKQGSTLLGTRGLYIFFPDDPGLSSYEGTTWYLDIPNKTSSSYGTNLNAYNEAKDERDLAIKNAESDYQKLLTEKNDGSSSILDAEIEKIHAEIKKNTIYAPFDGLITNTEKEVGEIASTNEPLITMISTGTFLIESYVPEINIPLIKLHDKALVTLDAYGENETFNAEVVSIDQAETVRDGVANYKIQLQFVEKDDRLKSGMTANVLIVIFSKPDVITVPGGVVFGKDGKKFVQVKNGKEINDREVVLGDISSLGQVEVVSGLEVGEMVVLNPTLPPVE